MFTSKISKSDQISKFRYLQVLRRCFVLRRCKPSMYLPLMRARASEASESESCEDVLFCEDASLACTSHSCLVWLCVLGVCFRMKMQAQHVPPTHARTSERSERVRVVRRPCIHVKSAKVIKCRNSDIQMFTRKISKSDKMLKFRYLDVYE